MDLEGSDPGPVVLFSTISRKRLSRTTEIYVSAAPTDRDEHVRFEVSTAVTMKNGVFSDVTPCGSYKNRRFGGT
jgi:hypothetical protein